MWSKADLKTYRFGPEEIEAPNRQLGKDISNTSDVAGFPFCPRWQNDDQLLSCLFVQKHVHQHVCGIKAGLVPFPVEKFSVSAQLDKSGAAASPPESVKWVLHESQRL